VSRRSEAGQVTVLVVGFAMAAILLVVVVVDASAAYLRRQRLDAMADGAALAAVDGIESARVYEAGLGERAALDPALTRRLVAGYSTALAHTAGIPACATGYGPRRTRCPCGCLRRSTCHSPHPAGAPGRR
jgi:hypothetical protein